MYQESAQYKNLSTEVKINFEIDMFFSGFDRKPSTYAHKTCTSCKNTPGCL